MDRDNDLRFVYSEYNQEATRVFFRLFNEFRNEADTMGREGDENVFQLIRAKYSATLKHQLEQIAGLLITKCDSFESQGRLRISFAEKIKYFAREFIRKSETL
jgi:hypothetical protein